MFGSRHKTFRKLGAGRYEVRGIPRRNGPSGLYSRLKRLIIGEPLATAAAGHERLTKVKALAVLSSDALSSVAYATEEIMAVLLLAGTAALSASLPIGAVLVILLFIVGFSYRQTIKAYPTGGGSYTVAKDNLGTLPGLTAAGSLLISYTLTVAVSVAAGVKALASAYPTLNTVSTEIGVVVIMLITLVNLRGIRESGTIFMLPTYAFLVAMAALIVGGLVRFGFGPPGEPTVVQNAVEPLTLFLMLRAFASGGAALTGVEAISDGVPAFKPPEWINAQKTLTAMVVILAVTFSGITYLANRMGIVPGVTASGQEAETVVSQIAHGVFGDTPLYYAVQYATFLILFLAANTAYSDFPRLAYFLGRDPFLPHQFTFPGRPPGVLGRDRRSRHCLVGGAVGFGRKHQPPDSAVRLRVFSAFTLSQSGMLREGMRSHVFYRPADMVTAGHLEDRVGRTIVQTHSGSQTRHACGWSASSTDSVGEREAPLLLAQDALQLAEDRALAFTAGTPPMLLERGDWRRDNLLAERQGQPVPPLPAVSMLRSIDPTPPAAAEPGLLQGVDL